MIGSNLPCDYNIQSECFISAQHSYAMLKFVYDINSQICVFTSRVQRSVGGITSLHLTDGSTCTIIFQKQSQLRKLTINYQLPFAQTYGISPKSFVSQEEHGNTLGGFALLSNYIQKIIRKQPITLYAAVYSYYQLFYY